MTQVLVHRGDVAFGSKIVKIYGVHAGVPSSGAPFFCERVTNKKTHFSRARSLRLHGSLSSAQRSVPQAHALAPASQRAEEPPARSSAPLGTQSGDCGESKRHVALHLAKQASHAVRIRI